MRILRLSALVAILPWLTPSLAIAGEPTCHTHSNGPYCQYTGKVSQAYIKSSGWIVLYFDSPLPSGAPAAVGISGITNTWGALYLMSEGEDFGKMLYSSLLSAQARDADVKIQMRGEHNGYLKIDRIWVYE